MNNSAYLDRIGFHNIKYEIFSNYQYSISQLFQSGIFWNYPNFRICGQLRNRLVEFFKMGVKATVACMPGVACSVDWSGVLCGDLCGVALDEDVSPEA